MEGGPNQIQMDVRERKMTSDEAPMVEVDFFYVVKATDQVPAWSVVGTNRHLEHGVGETPRQEVLRKRFARRETNSQMSGVYASIKTIAVADALTSL